MRNGLGPAGLSVYLRLEELFGLAMKSRLSKASFSACCDGIRRIPCLRGVVGWLLYTPCSAPLYPYAVDRCGGAFFEIDRLCERPGAIGAAGASVGTPPV